METKFTKGKWELDRDFIYTELSEVICDIDPIGVSKKVFTRSKEEAISNAKLIAAAPDLLAALELFVYDVENTQGNDNIFEEAYHLAKNAIKKATE